MEFLEIRTPRLIIMLFNDMCHLRGYDAETFLVSRYVEWLEQLGVECYKSIFLMTWTPWKVCQTQVANTDQPQIGVTPEILSEFQTNFFRCPKFFFPDTTSFGKKPKKGPKFFESKDQVSDRWMSIIEKKIVFFFWGALLDTRLFGTCDFVLRLNVVWQNVVWLIVIQPSHPSNKALNT